MNKIINYFQQPRFLLLLATLLFVGMPLVFSQVVETTTTPEPEPPQDLSLLELLMKGGPVMIPIVTLFICATYVAIERFLYIRSVTKGRNDFMNNIKRYILSGDIKAAR